MIDFHKELELTLQADEFVQKLETEDDMCEIADIVSSMNNDMLKRVLKKFVYKNK